MTMNGKRTSDIQLLYVDFNLRNLSISVFVNSNQLRGGKRSQFYFIELEDCEVDYVKGKFKHPQHLELTVKPLRYQILDEQDKSVDDLDPIESIQFVISEFADFFVSDIFPRYKSKAPMMLDSLTDNESMASFRTVNTFISNAQGKAIVKEKDQVGTQENKDDDLIVVEENSAPVSNVPKLIKIEPKSSAPIKNVTKSIPKVEPKTTRKTATILPTTKLPDSATRQARSSKINKVAATRNNYDDIPSDNDRLPPANLFLANRRIERQRKQLLSQDKENTESSGIPDYSEDLTWKPHAKKSAPKKRSNQKPVVKKNAQSRSKETIYSTEEEDEDEIEETKVEVAEQKKNPQANRGKKAKATTKPLKTKSPGKTKPLQQSREKSFENLNIPTPSTKYRAGSDYGKPVMKTNFENVRAEVDVTGKGFNERKQKASFKESALETSYPEMNKTFDKLPTTKPAKPKKQYPENNKSFDDLLQDETPEIPVVMTAVSYNRRVSTYSTTRAGHNDFPQAIDTQIGKTRKRKASFDNDSRYMEQRRSSSDESDAQQEASPNKSRRATFQEQVSFDLSKLKSNPLLGKYLKDQSNHENHAQDVYVKNSVQATQITSTTYRSVQIQAAYSPPREMTQDREPKDDELRSLFSTKANEVFNSMARDVERIIGIPVAGPKVDKIIDAAENCRESDERFNTHINEHVKLLKRLHHSKRQLMQYHEQNEESAKQLKDSIKQTMMETQKALDDKLQQLKSIHDSAHVAFKSIKVEIWQQYLQSISQQLNNLLSTHYDFKS